MRSVLAAITVALLTIMLALHVPSSAQMRMEDKSKKDEGEAAQRAKERKTNDSQYKSAIERLPDQKYDPWRNMR